MVDLEKMYRWDGEYEDMDLDEWWCQEKEEWTMCPGPCTDGSDHGPKRTRVIKVKKMVLK